MKKQKNEVKQEVKQEIKQTSFWNYLLVSGLLGWIVTLMLNFVLFIVTLFYNHDALKYLLVFFVISVAGHFLLRKR